MSWLFWFHQSWQPAPLIFRWWRPGWMCVAAPGIEIGTAQGGRDNRQNNVLFKDGSSQLFIKQPEEEGWNMTRAPPGLHVPLRLIYIQLNLKYPLYSHVDHASLLATVKRAGAVIRRAMLSHLFGYCEVLDVSSLVDIRSSSKSAFKSKQTLVAPHNRRIVSL